jgi:ATP-dependent protease HslVU (ClpYQ) peptidase subunit
MTCIVGLVHRGSVYIGGDSASVQGWTSRVTRLPKVFRRGPFLIGYTTSFRMGQLLQFGLEARPQRDDEDDMEFMVTEVAERVRQLLKERGVAKVESNAESGGQFLIGYRGRLFSVQQDFQVNEMADGYDAVGSGAEYALGAIRALDRSPPQSRLKRALEISAHFNMGVSGPFFVRSLRAAASAAPRRNGGER